LRADLYKQGGGQLKDYKTGAYCCLGVACELSTLGKFAGVFYVVDGPYSNFIPTEVISWLGDISQQRLQELVNLNDMHRKTFAEIADHIESWETELHAT
jgi:hypothetical protein